MKEIIAVSPKFVDLTNTKHLDLLKEAVGKVLAKYELSEIISIEKDLIGRDDMSLIFTLLVLKLAKSKLAITKIKEDVFISVVFAVYKEHNRIKPKSEHPHGEDFLRRKVLQLEWLFDEFPNFNWELIVVDDGCPEDSGKIAQQIVNENNLNDKIKVFFLEEAIKNNLPTTENLTNTSDSQKGGAITYGTWEASQRSKADNHIIIYTDADLSTHLGQTGLLIEPLLSEQKSVSIASRREPESVVIKVGTRNDRGKLFIYLWKRLIPNLGDIIDTQCGFKAFRKEIISRIIGDMIEKKFAFDIELLLKAELVEKNSVVKIPIAWIDSDLASTTTDLQPYLPMLQAIVKMYRKYFPRNEMSDEFADFIMSLDAEKFNLMVENIPEEILSREPSEFTEFDEINVADLSS